MAKDRFCEGSTACAFLGAAFILSKFRNSSGQTKEALVVGRSRHHDEMIAAGEIDAGLLKTSRIKRDVDQKLQGSTGWIFVEAETVAVAGWQSLWSFLGFFKTWLDQTGQTLVVEEAGSKRCTTFDSTRCCGDMDVDL